MGFLFALVCAYNFVRENVWRFSFIGYLLYMIACLIEWFFILTWLVLFIEVVTIELRKLE